MRYINRQPIEIGACSTKVTLSEHPQTQGILIRTRDENLSINIQYENAQDT